MNIFTNPNRADLQLALIVLLVLIAWYRGKGPEQSAALTLLGMVIVDRVYHAIFGSSGDLVKMDAWHFALDVGVLVVFVWIALVANRAYTLWLAAFQLVAVLAHLVKGFVEPVSPIAYYVMYVVPSYCQMIVVGIGLWAHRRRFAKFGEYRDWRVTAATG